VIVIIQQLVLYLHFNDLYVRTVVPEIWHTWRCSYQCY